MNPQLITALQEIPPDWQLTPLGKVDRSTGEIDPKVPYLNNWQKTDCDRDFISQELRSGKAVGFGLRLGEPSGYLVAIDFDGRSAIDFWIEKFGEVPNTVAWTSGKEGRYQALFQVPESFLSIAKTKKIETGEGEQLEFRYTGNQSVLPPSPHPETDGYTWINNPIDTPIAELPEAIIEYWRSRVEPKPRTKTPRNPKQVNTSIDLPAIPLENCLAKSNRDFLSGVHQGGRNDSGYKLACDLIGCAKYLSGEGVAFEGDPIDLFDRFASGCTPPLSDKESDPIWRSAEGSNPDPACTAEGIQNILEGWRRENSPKRSKGKVKAEPNLESEKLTSTNYQQLADSLGIPIRLGEDGNPKSKLATLTLDLFDFVGDRLRLNLMAGRYEFGGKSIDLDRVKSFVAFNLGADYSTENCLQALHTIGSKFAYHPVQQYLEGLRGKIEPNFDLLENLATKFLGNSDPLANKFLAKSLISAVARVQQPGTKVDTLTVLQGLQGCLKSTFLKILAGENWFCDQVRDTENKDDLAKLSCHWLIELAEVDYLMNRKEVESFKRFLSTTVDTFRPPYGRQLLEFPRTCSLWATTNKAEFLADPTGSRRYWVIKVNQKIDCDLVREYRDLIWATALAAYDRGDPWWLSEEEEAQRETAAAEFQEIDPWQESIETKWSQIPVLEQGDLELVRVESIFQILEVPIERRNKAFRNRIGSILRNLGFESKTVWLNGKNEKLFARNKSFTEKLGKLGKEIVEDHTQNGIHALPNSENSWVELGKEIEVLEDETVRTTAIHAAPNALPNFNPVLETDSGKTLPNLTQPNLTPYPTPNRSNPGTEKSVENLTQLNPTFDQTLGKNFKVGDRVRNNRTNRIGTIEECQTKKTPKGNEYVRYRVDFGFDSQWLENVAFELEVAA